MSTFGANYERECTWAVGALAEAAMVCERVQRHRVQGGALTKGDKSPVTVADFGAQAVIAVTLAKEFPGDAIMGEEDAAELREPANAAIAQQVVAEVQEREPGLSRAEVFAAIDRARSEGGSGRFWCLDPIDGTKGFLRGEQYAVALALLEGGEVKVGALACPSLPFDGAPGCILLAAKGCGARALTLRQGGAGKPVPVRVTPTRDGALARLVESVESGHGDHASHERVRAALRCATPSVRLDSQAKYAVLARGDGEIYLRMPTSADYRENLWDQAAGARIIEEAGGRVTDVDGRSLDFTRGRKLLGNQGIVATNGALHDAVLAAIKTLRA